MSLTLCSSEFQSGIDKAREHLKKGNQRMNIICFLFGHKFFAYRSKRYNINARAFEESALYCRRCGKIVPMAAK